MVVVDECDAMFWTHDCRQKMEQAYDDLMEMGPCLSVMISATPLPLMIVLASKVDPVKEGQAEETEEERQQEDIAWFTLDSSEEYMGLNSLKVLSEEGSAGVYLEPTGDLLYGSGFEFKNSDEANQDWHRTALFENLHQLHSA